MLLTNAVNQVICVLLQFVMDKTRVFDAETDSVRGFWTQLADSFSGRLLTLGTEELALFVFIDCLHQNSLLVELIAQIVAIVSSYVISKFFVSKKKD